MSLDDGEVRGRTVALGEGRLPFFFDHVYG